MADNEHPHEQPTAPPPAQIVPGDGSATPAPPPATRPPTEITPDQIRQFQEFQRFQELMRQQSEHGVPPGTPPPPGPLQPWGQPPPKQSLPKRLLKAAVSKIVTGLIVLAVLVVAGYFAVDYFFGEDLDDHPTASHTGGKGAKETTLFEKSPDLAVKKVYDDIAQGDWNAACTRFNKEARDQFTKDMSQYGATCREIVETIYNTVKADRMRDMYANPWIPASAVPAHEDPVSVSSCAMKVTGGPRLGLFIVSTMPDTQGQWIVSGHQAEPADCGGTSSTPPTT